MDDPESTIENLETRIVELENQRHDVLRLASSAARHRSQDDLTRQIAGLDRQLAWLYQSAARFLPQSRP